MGELFDVNLSVTGLNVPAGVPLYLSDTEAGGYTDTPPDLITRIGGVTDNSVNGTMVISIENLTSLPPVLALLQGQNAPVYNLTAVAQHVDGYPNVGNVIMGVDDVNTDGDED